MRSRAWCILVLAVVAAGCGGSSKQSATTTAPAKAKRCPRDVTARWTMRLERDVAAIRRAARRPTKDTLAGNPAINVATDRFLADVNTATIDLLVKNRFIDHAAAALVGSCQQCFQALEAGRPIPAISHAGRCGA
jgi:Flp pilus assembly protein TadD